MDDWYFQMYYDDLPVWGFIGKVCRAARQFSAAALRCPVAANSSMGATVARDQ